jgi:hypothetical protein
MMKESVAEERRLPEVEAVLFCYPFGLERLTCFSRAERADSLGVNMISLITR